MNDYVPRSRKAILVHGRFGPTDPERSGAGVRQQPFEARQVQDECLQLAPALMQLAGAPRADLAQELVVFEVAAGPFR